MRANLSNVCRTFYLGILLLAITVHTRTHVGDPFYIFTSHLSGDEQAVKRVCSIDDHLGVDYSRPKGETYDLLYEHLVAHGAYIGKTMPFESSPENYAMTATDDILVGDTIVYIPHDCIISLDVAMTSQINQAILSSFNETEEDEKFRNTYAISLFFMEERRNRDSFFRHHLGTMPRSM